MFHSSYKIELPILSIGYALFHMFGLGLVPLGLDK